MTTNREIHPHLHLDEVEVSADDLLVDGDPARGARSSSWTLQRAWTGRCAASRSGVMEAAVAQTAAYLNTREQFGRPLSTFQGTMLKAADAAIDTETVRVSMWQAAWRLDNGLDAERAVSVASWFASEAGQRAVFATQHLHGGIGADISYPIHRYFLWGKQIELMLGPAERSSRSTRSAGGRGSPAAERSGRRWSHERAVPDDAPAYDHARASKRSRSATSFPTS